MAVAITEEEAFDLYYGWSHWALPEQLPPEGDWTTWLLMGGRGAGKTMAGAQWVRSLASEGVTPIALVGETLTEALAVMVRGPSGILSISTDEELPRVVGAELHWPNGVVGTVLAANDPERFRGPQFAAAWCDEVGCGAVDKGANQPSAFADPKSVENTRPFFSSGLPDALMQRQYLRAQFAHWGSDANPVNGDGMPMVYVAHITPWAWDARPYPAFPSQREAWGDWANYATGHWLNGRLGTLASDELVRAIGGDYGVEVGEADAAGTVVAGYAVDAVTSAREAMAPVLAASGLAVRDTPEGLAFARVSAREPVEVEDVAMTSAR